MVSKEGGFVRRPSSRRISKHNLANKNILGGNRSACDRRKGGIVDSIGKSLTKHFHFVAWCVRKNF
jgi:hypothetical protein